MRRSCPKNDVVFFGSRKAAIKKAKSSSLKVTIPSKCKKGSVAVKVILNGLSSNTFLFVVK